MIYLIVGSILMLWIASLTRPVWRTPVETHKGYELLGIGCLAMVSGQVQWLGNPLILLTCYCALRGGTSTWLLAAIAAALTAVFVSTAIKRSVWMSTAGPPSQASTPISSALPAIICGWRRSRRAPCWPATWR